jgi:hypothetical protein
MQLILQLMFTVKVSNTVIRSTHICTNLHYVHATGKKVKLFTVRTETKNMGGNSCFLILHVITKFQQLLNTDVGHMEVTLQPFSFTVWQYYKKYYTIYWIFTNLFTSFFPWILILKIAMHVIHAGAWHTSNWSTYACIRNITLICTTNRNNPGK